MRKGMILALAASACMLSAGMARADKSAQAFVDPSSLLGNANGFTNANSANLAAKTYSVGAAKQSGCKMKLQFKGLSGFVDGELMICLAGADACITSPCNLSNFGNSIVVLPKYSSLSLKSGTKADFADVGCGATNAVATGASVECYKYSAPYIAGIAATCNGGGGTWLPNPTFVAGGEATDGLVGLCQWFAPPNGGNRLTPPGTGLVAINGVATPDVVP